MAEPTATSQPARQSPAPELTPVLPDQNLLSPAVHVEVVGSGDEQASTQHPAYLLAELTGRQISNVSLVGGGFMDDGRRQVLLHRPIDPNPEDDDWPGTFADGVADITQTWDFTADYLWDGQQGDFAILWVTDPAASTRTAHGRYRAAGGDSYADAVLVVDVEDGIARNVIDTSTGEAKPFAAGDEFLLTRLILDDQGALHSEPGTSLTFDEGGHLAYARRPVPSGSYFMGVSAESTGGLESVAYHRFEVNNDNLVTGYNAFLDLKRGFQMLYPEAWSAPVEEGNRVQLTDPADSIFMTVTVHPDMSGQPIADLKQRALAAYGDVEVLYEDQIEIGQGGGLRTAYGYQSLDGPRTGVLLTISQEGRSFLVDIDGPASAETTVLELAGSVADSWASRSVAPRAAGLWTTALVDGLEVDVPADHRPHQLSNGWQRFAGEDERTFLAMRSEPVAGRALTGGMEHWLGIAGGNVHDFVASDVYTHVRSGRTWARVDFEYAVDTGQAIAGAIMVTPLEDRFLILWAEAPRERFPQYEEQVLLMVIDGLSNRDTDFISGEPAP